MSGALDVREPGGVFALIRKTAAVFRGTLASQLTYVTEQLIRTLFLVLILYTFTQLWNATDRFQDVLTTTGFTIAQLIWYLAYTESIVMSSTGLRGTETDRDVKTGDLAYRLAKPIPYPLFQLGADLGTRVLRFAINLAVGACVALVVVGPIPLSPLSIAAALSLTLLVFVADWLWTFSISLVSFWVEDTFGVHLLYRRMLMLLGGMLLPLEAYPSWLENICRQLPFAYMIYHPSRLFVQAEPVGWWNAIGNVVLIGLVGLIPAAVLYHIGLRRLSAQGG